MFQSKKTNKTEYINLTGKDWRDSGPEIERLGQRIDAARSALATARRGKSKWAIQQWERTEAVLLRRWKTAINLHNSGFRSWGIDRESTPEIDYSWFETAEEGTLGFPIFDFLSYKADEWFGFTNSNLDRAWAMAQEEKLQKARQGRA